MCLNNGFGGSFVCFYFAQQLDEANTNKNCILNTVWNKKKTTNRTEIQSFDFSITETKQFNIVYDSYCNHLQLPNASEKKNMNLILLKDSFLWSGNSIEYFATKLQFHKAQFIFLKHIEYVLKQQRYTFDALFSVTSVRRLSAFDRIHQILSCNFPVSWTFSESCDSLCFVYGGSLSQCRCFPAWNVCYHWDNDFWRCVLCSLRIAHTVCHVLHCEITSDVRIACGTVTAGVLVPLPAAAFIFLSPFL